MKLRFNSIVFVFLSSGLLINICYFTDRQSVYSLLGQYLLLFGIYFFGYKSIQYPIAISIFLRAIVFFSIPALSDDFYRFIWDGNLSAKGLNPYLILPNQLKDATFFNQLNSPNYYTVYPPLLQYWFLIASLLAKGNFLLQVYWLKLPIFLAEIGSLLLLKSWSNFNKYPKYLLAVYGLNPLVIIELMGNLHYEAVMIFFVLLGSYLLCFGKANFRVLGAIFFALAVQIKLTPLLFLPYIGFVLGLKNFSKFLLLFLITIYFVSYQFLDAHTLNHILKSINLYFQKFEFNAGIYTFIRELGLLLLGYNIIYILGPLLGLIGTFFIVFYSYKQHKNPPDFYGLGTMAVLYSIFLFTSTTVHPWYICPIVAFASFVNYRYAMFWSLLGFFSYLLYQPYSEFIKNTLILIEYAIVLYFFVKEVKPFSANRPLYRHQ